MRAPRLQFLDERSIERIIDQAHQLLWDPGVMVYAPEALEILAQSGAHVDQKRRIARIPAPLVQEALDTAPEGFSLYNAEGEVAVEYSGDHLQFDPGSAAIFILDSQTGRVRRPVTADLVRHLKLAEGLEQLDAVSTALVCSDVPEGIADLYRLYLVLKYAHKPVVTGAFAIETLHLMYEMLVAVAGSVGALRERPLAIFDICPSPPLLWSEITCQNLVDCARYWLPVELVSMPLAGATAPATLVGALAQHTAENLSGVVIHQLTNPGAPIVYGGSPAIFDMRQGTTPMAAVETIMIDCAYTEIGKHLGFPTHAYLGMSDAKLLDGQAGLESALGTFLGALARVNMISGAGMLEFESCQSEEKLVIDNEIIGMARRLIEGIAFQEGMIPLELMREVGHQGSFLSTKHTREWFRREQFIPSSIIDRHTRQAWERAGRKNIVERAQERVEEIIAAYQPKEIPPQVEKELTKIVTSAARRCGLEKLPPLEG
ncbi:MAG: trimethylamine methyltransferase family protein [Anaerolineae bacterium]